MSHQETRDAHIQMKVNVQQDGSLANSSYERVAIRVGEGVPFHQAWTEIGKKHESSNQSRYRGQLQRQKAFKDRVAMIEREKEEAEKLDAAGDPWAETKFMVNQLYRDCRATGDVARMAKAVEMRMEIARQAASRLQPAAAPAQPAADAPPEEKNPVGRPAVEDPQTKRSMSDVRKALAERGVKLPPAQVATQ